MDSAPSRGDADSKRPRSKLNRKMLYLVVIKVVIAALVLGGFIAAAVAHKSSYFSAIYNDQVRTPYMALSMIFFVTYGLLAILMATNLVNKSVLARIPWFLIMLILDTIAIIGMLAVSIVSAMRESDIQKAPYVTIFFASGAFGAATALGIFAVIWMIVDVVLVILYVRKASSGVFARVPYWHLYVDN